MYFMCCAQANGGGIGTFFREDFREELDCLLGFNDDKERCPKPDTIIFNSGLHDQKDNLYDFNFFETHLRSLISSWKIRYADLEEGNVWFVWKGNMNEFDKSVMDGKGDFNVMAKRVIDSFSLPFVDISGVKDYVPRFDENLHLPKGGIEVYTRDSLHFGSYARGDHDIRISGTISMLTTQLLLHELCNNMYFGKGRENRERDFGKLVKTKDWN
jgi:hypothetical protein